MSVDTKEKRDSNGCRGNTWGCWMVNRPFLDLEETSKVSSWWRQDGSWAMYEWWHLSCVTLTAIAAAASLRSDLAWSRRHPSIPLSCWFIACTTLRKARWCSGYTEYHKAVLMKLRRCHWLGECFEYILPSSTLPTNMLLFWSTWRNMIVHNGFAILMIQEAPLGWLESTQEDPTLHFKWPLGGLIHPICCSVIDSHSTALEFTLRITFFYHIYASSKVLTSMVEAATTLFSKAIAFLAFHISHTNHRNTLRVLESPAVALDTFMRCKKFKKKRVSGETYLG